MALPFENDTTISSNPFLDILMKNLKILAYNCIIKDEYEANRKETTKSFTHSELYIACIENKISLGMFSEAGIAIPDEILYSVFDRNKPAEANIIKLYKNFGNSIEWIPKDIEVENDTENSRYLQTNYRHQLLIKLKIWFLQTYEEQNEYYRMVCGLPSLKSWGIPIRDYQAYLPNYIQESYHGDFIHELDTDIINDLNTLGILDIIRMEYPNEKYLLYLPASLDLYEVRKKSDLHILWMPSGIVNEEIKKEFESKYNERREYMIKTIYTSAMEIESEYYHATMIIFLLMMTILDMMAELQQHIIKKDILDRRCVEYLFSQKGITYYKNIPYKYQEKLCANLHSLIKYKSSTKDMLTLKSIFGFDEDIEIYRYYLMKIRKYNVNGDFVIEGNKTLISEPNDTLIHYSIEDDIENYQDVAISETANMSEAPVPDDNIDMTPVSGSGNDSPPTPINYIREIPHPCENYLDKKSLFFMVVDGYILEEGENKDYKIVSYADEVNGEIKKYIKIKQELFDDIRENNKSILYEYYVDENQNSNLIESDNTNKNIKINTVYVYNYSGSHRISLTEVFPFSYNYLSLQDKLWVVVGNYWLTKDVETEQIIIRKNLSVNYTYQILEGTDQSDVLIFKNTEKDNYYMVKENSDNTINLYEITEIEQDIKYEVLNYLKVLDKFILKDNVGNYWLIPSNIRNSNLAETYSIIENDGEYKFVVSTRLAPNTEYTITNNKISKKPIGSDDEIEYEFIKISKSTNTLSNNIILISGYYWLIRNFSDKIETISLEFDKDENKYTILQNNTNKKEFSLSAISSETYIDYKIQQYRSEFKIIVDPITRNHILEISDDLVLNGKDMYIIYFESNEADIRFYKKDIDIANTNQSEFNIPEPFPYYIYNDNDFYLTLTTVTCDNTGQISKSSEFIPKTSYRQPTENITDDVNAIPTYKIEITDTNIKNKFRAKPQSLSSETYTYTKLGFNFIYSADSIINEFNLTITLNDSIYFYPTYNNQIEFSIKNLLQSNNIKNIHNIYMKYDNKWLNPNTDFSYTQTNIIVDDSITINDIHSSKLKDQKIDLKIIYSNKDNKNIQYNNILTFKQFFMVEHAGTNNTFNLTPPINNFWFYKYNTEIIDVSGEYLEKYQYNIDKNTKVLTVYKELSTNSVLNITYIYNNIGTYKIKPTLDLLKIQKISNIETHQEEYYCKYINSEGNLVDDNSVFVSPITETITFDTRSGVINNKKITDANSFEVIIGDKLVDNANITYIDKSNISEEIQQIIISNLNYIFIQQYNTITSNILNLDLLFFNLKTKETTVENTNTENNTDIFVKSFTFGKTDLLKRGISISNLLKEKFDFQLPLDYFDNQWPYYITYKDSNNKTILLPDKYYDLLDGKFYVNERVTSVTEMESQDNLNKYTDIANISEFTFNFVYLLKTNYIYYKYLEEYDKNIQLEFCKVPISEESHLSEYLSDQSNWKDYDTIINVDSWWTGNKYKNNYNELLKKQIYEEKFNVIRTKYYSLSQEEDFTKYNIDTSLFYSMLYDNVFSFTTGGENSTEQTVNFESDMKLGIESISTYHKFLVSHLFLYMICLSYIYNNQELPKLEHPTKIRNDYAIGFNFNTSLENIKETLQNVYYQDLDVNLLKATEHEKNLKIVLNKIDFGFNNSELSNNLGQRFMEIYNANKEAYKIICDSLLNTENILEFKVWNYLYYELFTWKYDTEYFLIHDGSKLADTYEEFLKDQDEILYNSIVSIKNIYDTDTKIDLILKYLEDIEYALGNYFFGDRESRKDNDNEFLIKSYSNKFTSIIISYMKQMLDFFKSYKVYIKDLDTIISFDNGQENEENSYKIYEEIVFKYTLNFLDYISFDESVKIITRRKEINKETGLLENKIVNIEQVVS